MNNIINIYEKSGLVIQSFILEEILNEKGEYKKKPRDLNDGWQTATKNNIKKNKNHNGFLLNTGNKIGDKYIIGVDIDNKDDKKGELNGLDFWNNFIEEKELNITTPRQKTGNNGYHYLFLLSEEQYKIISGNITGLKVGSNKYTIDIKCKNGCLYVEPTIYKSLETGEDKKYVWEVKPELNNFQDIPTEIYDLIKNHYLIKDKPKTKKVKKMVIDDKGEEKEIEVVINEREIDFTNIKVNSENEKLLYILSPERFFDTDKWINIGIIMKSLNFSYELYAILSKEYYDGFNNDICLKYWRGYKIKENIKIGLLHYLAKTDNLTEYEKLNIIVKETIIYMDKIEIKKNYLIDEKNENLDETNCEVSHHINKFFMTNLFKSFNIKSPYGTGKTKLLKIILKKYNNNRILWLSYRKTLTMDIYSTFSEFGFRDYQDGLYGANKLIIQLESLFNLINLDDYYNDKIEIPSYDLIIIDEVESILLQFNSPTFKGKSKEVFYLMTALIENSNRMITLDGDMHNRSYNFIKYFGKSININNDIKVNKKHFLFTKSRENYDKEIIKDLDDNKKIVIVSMSSNKCKEYYDFIKSNYKNKKVLIYTGNTGDEDKKDLKNVKELWLMADILLYSPIIEAGVNFDVDHFDKMYGIVCYKSTSSRAFCQMMARIRKIKDNNIYILNEQFEMNYLTPRNINKIMKTNFYVYDEVKTGILQLEDIKTKKKIIKENGKNFIVNEIELYDENYIYNKCEQLNNEYEYFMSSLICLLTKKGHTYEILKGKKTKRDKTKTLTEHDKILKIGDINDIEYEKYLEKQKKSIATEEEKYKVKKHSLKLLYGVDILNEEILKVDKSQIKNFIILIDINNIKERTDNQSKESKKKIELILNLLNNIGFENIYTKKIIIKYELENNLKNIIENSFIFKDEITRKILFNESKHKMEEITNNKQFLGYVNSLLFNYCLKISSFDYRIKKLKKKDKIGLTEKEIKAHNDKSGLSMAYKLERLMNIDEIIDYKIRKGFILEDTNKIRKYDKTEIYKDLIYWTIQLKNTNQKTIIEIMYPAIKN